jgi:hypothetical protein
MVLWILCRFAPSHFLSGSESTFVLSETSLIIRRLGVTVLGPPFVGFAHSMAALRLPRKAFATLARATQSSTTAHPELPCFLIQKRSP